jgi:hypothetical protein
MTTSRIRDSGRPGGRCEWPRRDEHWTVRVIGDPTRHGSEHARPQATEAALAEHDSARRPCRRSCEPYPSLVCPVPPTELRRSPRPVRACIARRRSPRRGPLPPSHTRLERTPCRALPCRWASSKPSVLPRVVPEHRRAAAIARCALADRSKKIRTKCRRAWMRGHVRADREMDPKKAAFNLPRQRAPDNDHGAWRVSAICRIVRDAPPLLPVATTWVGSRADRAGDLAAFLRDFVGRSRRDSRRYGPHAASPSAASSIG